MNKIIATVALLLMVPAWASAQNPDHQYRDQGYVFIGEGSVHSSDNGLHGNAQAGAGAEVLLIRGFGVGGELGVMGTPGHGGGIVSIDPSYRFLRKSKLVPFVEGGYSRAFGRNDTIPPTNLFNFGGGISYWAFKRVGLRLEVRDHVHSANHSYFWGDENHYWGVRIGLTFR